MNEQNKTDEKSPQVTSGITIAALLLGLFFLQDTFLNPTRPGMIDTENGYTENIRARLWQDPFQVVNEHINKSDPKKIIIKEVVEQLTEKHPDKSQSTKFKRSQFPTDPDQAIEYGSQPTRVCYRDGLYKDNEEAAHSIKELRCQIESKSADINTTGSISGKPSDINVLAVMVPGGPYAEDREWRLRSRYALIMALLAQGYSPEDADHIGFVHFANVCKKTDSAQGKTTDICNMPAIMPYEWFNAHTNDPEAIKRVERTGKILVLWLDNDAFNRSNKPLYMLNLLNKIITSDTPKETSDKPKNIINFNVIGPSNSDTLEKIYQEVNKLNIDIRDENYYEYLNNSYLYTASATVQRKYLSGTDKIRGYLKRKRFKNNINNIDWLDKTIVRTISTQDKVANTLLCELALRGVTPYRVEITKEDFREKCDNFNNLKLNEPDQPHQIALIGEADTYYATILMRSISDEIQEFHDLAINSKESREEIRDFNHIHFSKYLRGLDGITSQNISTDQDKSKDREQKVRNPSEKDTKTILERPIGNSQLDYLLGLGENLKRLEKKNITEGKGTFKAIGILGSDTYDKLLILQALRSKFPGIPFFTTDLDARFLHPSEIKWTRNLIVVSPFGLQLNKTLQKFSPPFRDNFQTSLYISTLLAITCADGYKQCKESALGLSQEWSNYPRVFEIGNHEAVNLSHTTNDTFLDIQTPREQFQPGFITFAITQSGILPIAISIILLALASKFFIPKQSHISLGISVIISLISLILYEWISNFDGFEPISFTNGISSWPANAIRSLAALLAVYFLVLTRKQLKANQKEIQYEFQVENKAAKKESLKSGLNIDNWKINNTNLGEIWFEYLEKNKSPYTFFRITFMIILFVIFIIFIFKMGLNRGFIPPSPFRGEINTSVSMCIFWVTVVAYLALTLYIADNVHLSSHFIKLLADNPSIAWSNELVEIYKNKYNLPKNIIEYKILLDFVNRHTEVHNKFIYYPFFCLFLIIMARNNYFDNWLITPFMVFVYIFFALITLMSAIRLRAAALYAKKEILKKLNTNSAQSPINEWRNGKNDNVIKLKSLITEIENFKEGIFSPLLHHPMILSLLMPFSSVGGVYLIEYLV